VCFEQWLAMLGMCSWSWNEIEDEESDVILLGAPTFASGPATKFEQQRVGELRRGRRRRGEEFFQARLAELFARGVRGFQDPIRVKKNAGAGAERNLHGRIHCLRKKTEHQAIGFDLAAFGVARRRVTASRKKQRRVPGAGVAQ